MVNEGDGSESNHQGRVGKGPRKRRDQAPGDTAQKRRVQGLKFKEAEEEGRRASRQREQHLQAVRPQFSWPTWAAPGE